MVARIM